ncbi:hypothetical protein [Mycobacterium deserti]|uniref:Uncharacterized protein n=1 Tax=Mycobacterium deserti TaxID=2978347 RepID=A0ABT2M645_9MYCO|nr:hypothetical protein [Mycobacterium deserti]MCT7657733.1 hypothetical protein [Mycobacterium deserti]
MSVKDDLLSDLPHVYPTLARPEVERLLTLLDQSAGTEGSLGMSIATSLKPLTPEVASRIESYKKSDNVDDYVRMLRGAAVLLLQKWQPDGQPPAPEDISAAVENLEASD